MKVIGSRGDHRRGLTGFALALVAGLTLGACGGPTSPAADQVGADTSVDPALVKLLPSDVKSSKSLKVATGTGYPPLEFTDENGELTGFDVELLRLIGEKLDVTMNFEKVSFDALITSIQGGRYDIGAYGVLDKPERQDLVTFVDHLNTSSSILMRADDDTASDVSTIDDLCGLSAGANAGETQVTDLEAASDRCVKAGDSAIDVQTFTESTDARLALTSSRIDAIVGGTPGLVYYAEQEPRVQIAGKPYRFLPYGLVIAKDRQDLVEAIQKALQQLIDDGTYAELLDKYDLAENGVDKATVNIGTENQG
ncbi:ABC transporter substrate-binding protein [Nocardioidaceae bacterium SCSIO 66511]|nr:ABC transporter substrate-binding protein [Nocardioidaceae bacterium SCSIO 66511]